MQKRKVDHEALKALIKKTYPNSIRGTSFKLGISWTFLKRLCGGKYPYEVKERNRQAICEHLGVSEDTLFPFFDETEAALAS